MNINYLRASGIKTYKDCPFKFFLEHVLGLHSPAGKAALMGTIVHHVLELVAKASRNGYKTFEDKYRNVETCLHICWEKYTKENPQHEYDPKDLKFCREQVKLVLDSDLNPLKRKVIRTEQQFEIVLKKDAFAYDYVNYLSGKIEVGNMKMRGTIDLITELDSDTIEIIDWKTGRRSNWNTGEPMEMEDFYKDIQLRFYDIARTEIFKKYKYCLLTVVFIRDGGPYTVTFDASDRVESFKELEKTYNKILYDKNINRLKDDSSRYKESWKCKYVCHFGAKYSNNCDKFYKILKKNGPKIGGQEIVKLTLGGAEMDNSRRNDYTNTKIFKGEIK